MQETYVRILQMIDKQPPALKDLAKRALTWVISAGRPLSPHELALAVAINPKCQSYADIAEKYQPKTVIDACRGFVTVQSNQVRLVHNTIREFLTSPPIADTLPRLLQQEYRVIPGEAHLKLAHDCIQYVQFPGQTGHSLDEHGSGRNALYVYAVNFFDYHIHALDPVPDSLREKFRRLAFNQKVIEAVFASRIGNRRKKPTALSFCLALDLLQIFQLPGTFDATVLSNPRYMDVLHNSASSGSISSIQKLLGFGCLVDALDESGVRPLYYAALKNREPAVQILLENGAKVNEQGGEYGNALQAAVFGGYEKLVQMLLENRAKVNTQGGRYGNPLQAAAYRGYERVLQMLMKNGADVNAQGGEYGNALQAAAYRGYGGVVQMLLDNGADINAQGGRYGNALQAAACLGHQAVMEMLLRNGADINAQGGEYGNALQTAAYRRHEGVVCMLLKNGANINAQCGYFGNALQAAAYIGDARVVSMLVENGADINAQGGYFGNALQAAAYVGDVRVVPVLLENGADINVQSSSQAAVHDSEKIVRMLLQSGANVNAQGGIYGNALQAARATSGNETVVQMLLDAGA